MPRTATRRNYKHCSSACLSCRKKKKRCSGEQPVCKLCSKNDLQCVWATADDRRTARARHERERELCEENAQLKAQNTSLTALVTMLTSGVPMTSEAAAIDSPTGMLVAGGYDALPVLHFGAAHELTYPPNSLLAAGDFSTGPTTRLLPLNIADRTALDNDTLAPAYAPRIGGIMPLHAAAPLLTGGAAILY